MSSDNQKDFSAPSTIVWIHYAGFGLMFLMFCIAFSFLRMICKSIGKKITNIPTINAQNQSEFDSVGLGITQFSSVSVSRPPSPQLNEPPPPYESLQQLEQQPYKLEANSFPKDHFY